VTVKTAIIDIDNQGEGKTVLTKYEPHTIAIVGINALGVNINKVKSKSVDGFLKTDKGKELMSKVNKAKALDKEANPELTEEELKALEDSKDVEGEDKGAEDAPVIEPEAETPVVDTVVDKGDETPSVDVTETPEGKTEAPVVDEVPEEKSSVEDEVAPVVDEVEEPVIEVAEESEAVNKAKSFTSGEVIQAQKDALDGVHEIVQKIMKAMPDAEIWEVTDLVYSAIWRVEDAVYDAKNSLWDDIYNETFSKVTVAVNKAKALKVAEDGSLEMKLKALEKTDPSMAALLIAQMDENRVNKAKALEAENETKKVIRAKALEKGAVEYKRIATEGNTTEQIVDAMASIAISDTASHTVIAKALATASAITMGGDLFVDMGSSENAVHVSEGEYVLAKAKSLVEDKGGNLAAAKATVRQSEEYTALYK
jgi:hypothetical protein